MYNVHTYLCYIDRHANPFQALSSEGGARQNILCNITFKKNYLPKIILFYCIFCKINLIKSVYICLSLCPGSESRKGRKIIRFKNNFGVAKLGVQGTQPQNKDLHRLKFGSEIFMPKTKRPRT